MDRLYFISQIKKSSPIVVILFLISSDIVGSHLSNILLFLVSFLRVHMPSYLSVIGGRSIAMHSCNDLLESNLNHIRTTKHLSQDNSRGIDIWSPTSSCFIIIVMWPMNQT